MSITHHFYEEYRVVVVSWQGSVTDDELLPCYKDAYTNPNWQPGLSEIADLRNADLSLVTFDGLRNFASEIEPFYQGVSHNTAVISAGDLSYGLARFYEMMRIESTENLRVFSELATAIAWLGIDKAFLEGIS